MATPTLEQVHARLLPLLSAGETLQHWAFGQTKPKPSWWLLLLFPVVLVLALFVAVTGAQVAIGIGLIEPGPMMPVVGVPLGFVIFAPYMYLLLKSIFKCAVGLTDRRLLVVDLADGGKQAPTREVSLAESGAVKSSAGFVPQLVLPGSDRPLKVAFPLNVRGNKEQATAIAQKFSRT